MARDAQQIIAEMPSHIAVRDPSSSEDAPRFVYVKPGESGYHNFPACTLDSLDSCDDLLTSVFNTRKPTDAERRAATAGSMFGWHVPRADPEHPDNQSA